MAKKKRIKLNEDQKRWLHNLEVYLDSFDAMLMSDQNLKECMLDGPHAVLHGTYNDKGTFEVNVLVCCESVLTAIAVMRYNPGQVFRLIDLDRGFVVEELKKINKGFMFC